MNRHRTGRKVLSGTIALLLTAQSTLASRRGPEFWSERRRSPSALSRLAAALPLTSGADLTTHPFSDPGKWIDRSGSEAVRKILKSLPSTAIVRRVSAPARDGGRVVVLLQDIHDHVEAQRNIGEVMAALVQTGSVGAVGLEGAFHSIDTDRYRRFSRRGLLKVAADDLLAGGEINGALHRLMADVELKDFPVWGIDDRSWHVRNAEGYRTAQTRLPQARAAWETESRGWRTQGATVSTALRDFCVQLNEWNAGRRPLGQHIETLAAIVAPSPNTRRYLNALGLERVLDFQRADAQRRQWLEQSLSLASEAQRRELIDAAAAFRAGGLPFAFYGFMENWGRWVGGPSPQGEFQKYLAYVRWADGVDAAALYDDLARMEGEALDRWKASTKEKEWALLGRRLSAEQKLLDFALTPHDWKRLKSEPFLNEPEFQPFRDFYAAAEARDEAMSNNLLSSMDQSGVSNALLVAGGFHTAGLENHLIARGVHVVTVAPRVSRVDPNAGTAYLTAFAREKTPLDKLFDGQKLFLAREINAARTAFDVALRVGTLDDSPADVFSALAPETVPEIGRFDRHRSGDRPSLTVWFRQGVGARAVYDALKKKFAVTPLSTQNRGFWSVLRIKTREKLFIATGLVLGAAYGLPGVGAAALLTYLSPERPFGPPAVTRRTTTAFFPTAPRFETPPETTRPLAPVPAAGADGFEDFKTRVREFYALFETDVVNKFAGKTVHDVEVPNVFYNQRDNFLSFFTQHIKELPRFGERLNAEAEAGLPESVALRDRLITMLGYLQVFARDAEGREHSPTAGALFNVSRALFGRFHFPEHESSSLDHLINALTHRKPIVLVLTDVALDTDTMISTAMETRRRRMLNPQATFVPVINGDFIPAEARHLLGNALADDFLFLKDVRTLGVNPANASVLLMDHNENHTDFPVYGVVDHHVLCPLCASLNQRGRSIGAIPQTPSTASLVTLAYWGMGVRLPNRILRALYGATLMDTENATESKMNDHVLNRTFLRFAAAVYFGPQAAREGEDPANRLRRLQDDFYNEIMRVFLAEDNPKALFERDKKPFPGLVWANIQVLDKYLPNGIPSPAFATTLDYFALRARTELTPGVRAVVYNIIRYKTDPEDEESIIIRGNDLRLAFRLNEDPVFKNAMVEVARNFVADQPSTQLKSLVVHDNDPDLVWIHSKSSEALARKKLQPMFDRVIRTHDGAAPGTLRWLWSAANTETAVLRLAPWESWGVALAVGATVPALLAAGLSPLWSAAWGAAWGLAHLGGSFDAALRPVSGRRAFRHALALAAVGTLWTAFLALGLDFFNLTSGTSIAASALAGLLPRRLHALWNAERYWTARAERHVHALSSGAALQRRGALADETAALWADLDARPVRSLGVGDRFESLAEARLGLGDSLALDLQHPRAARALRAALLRRGVDVADPQALRTVLSEWLAPTARLFFVARETDLTEDQWNALARSVEKRFKIGEAFFVVPAGGEGPRVQARLAALGLSSRGVVEDSFRNGGVSLAALAANPALALPMRQGAALRLYAPADVVLDAAGASPAWRDAVKLRETLLDAVASMPILRTNWDLIERIARAVETAA